MCCCKLYCGAPCIFGSAMEKAGLGSCCSCCCFSSCCYPCAVFNARTSVAAKYGITESMPESLLYAFCCCGCSFIQVINQVLSPNGSPSVVSISTPPLPAARLLELVFALCFLAPPFLFQPGLPSASRIVLPINTHRFLSKRTRPGSAAGCPRRREARPRSRPWSAKQSQESGRVRHQTGPLVQPSKNWPGSGGTADCRGGGRGWVGGRASGSASS